MTQMLRIWSAAATIAAGLGLGAKPVDPAVLAAAPFTIIFSPAYPSFPCSSLPPPGTVISKITTIGGKASPVTLSLAGDMTDFALSATTVPANLVVAPGGISSSQCPAGAVDTVTVTATQ
jgi:hypothetical protein